MYSSSSSEFFIAFGWNGGGDNTVLKLLISSVEPGPVPVTVETSRRFSFTGFATNNETLEVVIPTLFQLLSSSERDKGIRVTVANQSKIVVYGVNYRYHTSDGFLALPCRRLPVEYYEYFGSSYAETRSTYYNYFLFVACEDNTRVLVGSDVIQLNSMETYFWQSRSVTGERVISNKPLSVFVGNRCTLITSAQHRFCDHFTEQVPPTVTWGTKFLSASLAGRSSGDLYRILAAQASTTVTVRCNTFDSFVTYNLDQPGSWQEFTTPAMSYCSITSDKPLLLMQFTLGYESDDVGDPFMMMITPVEQYGKKYVLNALQEFSANFITIYVTPRDYQPHKIFVDDANLENSTWNTVYDSNNETCGYITYATLAPGDHHVYHANSLSRVGVSVYGFTTGNSYGYPGGLQIDTLQSL